MTSPLVITLVAFLLVQGLAAVAFTLLIIRAAHSSQQLEA